MRFGNERNENVEIGKRGGCDRSWSGARRRLRHKWPGLTLPLMTLRRTLGVVFFVCLFSLQALAASPFEIRGIKGLWWEGLPNYRKALPWVAEHHENFLMLCYSS